MDGQFLPDFWRDGTLIPEERQSETLIFAPRGALSHEIALGPNGTVGLVIQEQIRLVASFVRMFSFSLVCEDCESL